ncbi:molybdopterin-dependent oxidoreductase [Sulfurimonas sp. RIFOXYB12_FULL_35_9]|uniref:molybdopterin oxidoreductase family protein n=1 Tax=Sulfurimonas sp. RIFOXYB12_FULL_35_9 TaxID=1802256 RepID=UPI0008B27BB7|nr:molybdopterin-dependent oxidoreductase [Sulfurimonas sp. RIFOXYB12_FULL_35_9]MBS4067372.1 molybdopterin-dependent oxidoreductase [Sulfurimonas sp.]MDX9756171.1 molybdopterin-dependent oxidoreductase [Sulfurimonas sp.]OHE03736.1 MAG: formate dehydrogenase [Sulfurimonas sp. RIFOXYB12_FULL_35_9]
MENTKTIDSVCTYCGVGCDIAAYVKDNKIIKIFAHPDGVVSQGKLCVKGKYGFDFVDSKERLSIPRIKKRFLEKNPAIKDAIASSLVELDDVWFECDLDSATTASAMKLQDIHTRFGRKSIASIGGARTSCESVYLFQKFTRHTLNSPHVDNCARVCHSPSLKGMRTTIGEGAATNPYNDIYNCEFMIVIGSNTIEAHPIIANRIVEVAVKHDNMAVFDVREIKLHKFAKYKAIMPYEANLLVLNMLAYVIITEELYSDSFIAERTKGFDEFKDKILNDPYANPKYFENIEGYEYLGKMIPKIAREYALKKSMIFWGLGITEHIDGSYAVMAITHLALMTGNIGKSGAGLMPLRGQNNVQGACDMGMLPYYDPDYQTPKEIGLMTPQLVDKMLSGDIKAVLNMGEDLMHIHPNINKIEKALQNLDFLMVQELFMTEIAQRADIVIGVKSAYEKTGVYINAMRRLHLSQPLVESDLPDDWEVVQMLDNKMGGNYAYKNSNQIWDEVREVAYRRFSGASYIRLERHRKRGLQWPVHTEDTPILHQLDFRTDDGLGEFHYHQYKLRGMVEEIVNKSLSGYYLTTGRTIAMYNNSAQTKQTPSLMEKYSEDLLLVNEGDACDFTSERVILKSQNGQTASLRVKFTDKVEPKTIFTTFHHADSKINALFGDERDELILTPAFKSIKVEVINV